ncbi:MAG: glycerol kinase GlpK [Clostridia bacterium]
MEKVKYVLSLDQGTTSSRAIVFNSNGEIVGVGQNEFKQYYPKPSFVEHDALEILQSQLDAVRQALTNSNIEINQIEAVGITNQRETTVAWDSETGIPIYNAIVWQCRRTDYICEELVNDGLKDYIKETTGLLVDPYFSGTKMKWIMDNVPKAKDLSKLGRLRIGTIDTWLIYSLTKGEKFVTDVTNASRTMIFDIHKLCWDEKIINYLGIPMSALPKVVESSGICGFTSQEVLGAKIPIAGVAGDQHAALFGQCCFDVGSTKNTYGTGCFTLMNTGDKVINSQNGLLSTIAWSVGGEVCYALEGSAFNAGSAIQWLRDELKIIKSAQECDMLAETIDSTGGVYFVPAFTGLGAPYWDMYARGSFLGLTRGTGKAEIARAVLESIVYESCDLFKAMEHDSGAKIPALKVDGGASKSEFLMQYQADMLAIEVQRPICMETTALGAAMLAGLATGVWESKEKLKAIWNLDKSFKPNFEQEKVDNATKYWQKAVNASRNWAQL